MIINVCVCDICNIREEQISPSKETFVYLMIKTPDEIYIDLHLCPNCFSLHLSSNLRKVYKNLKAEEERLESEENK